MTIIKTHLDRRKYTIKPSDDEIKIISYRITTNLDELTLQEFAHWVGEEGYAFTRALFPVRYKTKNKGNFQSQQLFVLDIDEGLSYKDFKKRCEKYNLYPFLTYKSLRASATVEKYRAVFLNDLEITDGIVADLMNNMLFRVFPESDRKCIELSRLFLGGKEIIEFEEYRRINLLDLSTVYQAFEKERDVKNSKRNICNLAKKVGVICEDGMLCIYEKSRAGRELPEKYQQVGDIIIGISDKEKDISGKTREKSNLDRGKAELPLLQITRQELEANCPLLRDFRTRDLDHGLKFLLATSLVYIKGGKGIFFSCLKDHEEKWQVDWKRFKVAGYYPQCCNNAGCPYADRCCKSSLYSKSAKKIREINGKKEYVNIEEAQNKLKEYFVEAIGANDTGIHLIKAQTALGKTEMYCNMAAQHPEIHFMFVVPTIKLQWEVCEKLKKKGVEAYKTESSFSVAKELGLSIADKIQKIYNAGCGGRVKALIRKFIEENENELEDWERQKLKDSLDTVAKLEMQDCVVTTHKMFLHLPQRILKRYMVVIDEDIAMSVIKENQEVSLDIIEAASNSSFFTQEQIERLDQIKNMKDKDVIGMTNEKTEIILNPKIDGYEKVYGLLNASVCSMDRKLRTVHFFKAIPLPDVKMIVLSATLNDKLYRDYCMGRDVEIREVPEVKIKGQLKQNTAYSMSRQCIEERGRDNVLKVIKDITGLEEESIISFKNFDETKQIYYGKAEGFNDYAGKDLVVLGTPHSAECVYLLIGKYLGYDISDTLSVHRVEKNGFTFPIMTYGNKHLQNLQLYFIESELEQAVGRARLLRNDCTVYLFSNFPLRQATICQDDYMKQENAEES